MIPLIIWLIIWFTWLAYETRWFTVRLMVGDDAVDKPKRKWQFVKYGDDALLLCHNCNGYSKLTSWRTCPSVKNGDWFAWQIPARTITAWGSTMTFKAGCNRQRAKFLRDIATAQKGNRMPAYKSNSFALYGQVYNEGSIQLLVDGKPIANIDGNYKRGMIKQVMKPYTSKIKRR